ncbi:MAG TPA: TetR/AcrR family transcriptional regulator [Acetobacteraceae bacterium]|nr:TetR/AcrR family transcriptional regulator [Acetobacteraceae bacterium]
MSQSSALQTAAEEDQRGRILDAAWSVFMEIGYGGASTAEIARRARVSKRDLYARFGSKRGIVAALVSARAARMQAPLRQSGALTRDQLAATLRSFGAAVLREASQPGVLALYRLAISEAGRDTGVAEVLDSVGRGSNRAALAILLADAQRRGLVGIAKPNVMASHFLALLWDDLFSRLLLGIARAPSPSEADRRARDATKALLRLYPAD